MKREYLRKIVDPALRDRGQVEAQYTWFVTDEELRELGYVPSEDVSFVVSHLAQELEIMRAERDEKTERLKARDSTSRVAELTEEIEILRTQRDDALQRFTEAEERHQRSQRALYELGAQHAQEMRENEKTESFPEDMTVSDWRGLFSLAEKQVAIRWLERNEGKIANALALTFGAAFVGLFHPETNEKAAREIVAFLRGDYGE